MIYYWLTDWWVPADCLQFYCWGNCCRPTMRRDGWVSSLRYMAGDPPPPSSGSGAIPSACLLVVVIVIAAALSLSLQNSYLSLYIFGHFFTTKCFFLSYSWCAFEILEQEMKDVVTERHQRITHVGWYWFRIWPLVDSRQNQSLLGLSVKTIFNLFFCVLSIISYSSSWAAPLLLAAPKWLELETSGVLHIIFWLRSTGHYYMRG